MDLSDDFQVAHGIVSVFVDLAVLTHTYVSYLADDSDEETLTLLM